MAVNCGIYKMIMLKLCVFLGARPFAVYGISQRRPIVTFCIEFVTVGLWRMSFIVVVYCFLCVVCEAKIGLSITLLNVQLFTRKCVPQWVVILLTVAFGLIFLLIGLGHLLLSFASQGTASANFVLLIRHPGKLHFFLNVCFSVIILLVLSMAMKRMEWTVLKK